MTSTAQTFQRGTRVECTLGGGRIATGKVLRLYTDKDVAAHRKSHGEHQASILQQWIPCELRDEQGTFSLAVHQSQLRAVA
jgi:hypothetical protein